MNDRHKRLMAHLSRAMDSVRRNGNHAEYTEAVQLLNTTQEQVTEIAHAILTRIHAGPTVLVPEDWNDDDER